MSETMPCSPHRHAVQFYGTDKSLFLTVAGFLSEGIVSGQPAIVIATPEHRVAIEEHLRDRLVDCDAARLRGELQFLDAEETLSLFMVEGKPDAERFEASVGSLVDLAVSGRPHTVVRAYGEMVDVLWKQGQTEAAINLEILWNKLALKHNFALLCGYAMGSFYKQTRHLEEIAALHSEVITDTVVPFDRKRAAR